VGAHTFNKQTEKIENSLFARKLISPGLWGRKGVLMVEFMQQGTAIRSEEYCGKGHGKLTYGGSAPI
jgi:hypothetical protein